MHNFFSAIKRDRIIRFFVICLLVGVAVASSGFFAVKYKFAQDSLTLADESITYLETEREKLLKDFNEAQDTVVQKDQEIQTKNGELEQAKKDLEKSKTELIEIEKELSKQKAKISNQEAQLTANAAELSDLRDRAPLFSFQNSSGRNVDGAQKDVEEVVKVAYDEIQSVYSRAYLLHSVTISFVEKLNNPKASGEIKISNGEQGLSIEIKLTDFDKNNFQSVNTVIHEVIHSFHGLATLDPVAYEEGITIAATDKVMQNLADQGKIPKFSNYYIHISDSQYGEYNADGGFQVPSDRNGFYGEKAATYYQVTGYAWRKLASADGNFYRNYNEKFYNKIRNGEKASKELVLSTIRETVSSVDGQSIDDFLNSNKAFALN